METVLIAGGSGMLGIHLKNKLIKKGYQVNVLGRANSEDSTFFTWNLERKEIDLEAITSANYIINLAGAGITDKRWSKFRKNLLISSRVDSTQLLMDSIVKTKATPKAFISASGVGYYGGFTSDKIFVESDSAANDFLGDCCVKWEQATFKNAPTNVRKVVLRIGVVLTQKSGALAKIAFPFRFGLGANLATGKQYFPWIHIDDLCNGFVYAIENESMVGSYNLVAPSYVTNSELGKIISNILKKPFFMPNVPSFLLKIILGEMAVVVTEGSRVSSEKIQKEGFVFRYTSLKNALSHLLD